MIMGVAVVAVKIGVPPRWWISSSGRTILGHRKCNSAQQQSGRRKPIRDDLVMIFSMPISERRTSERQ